MVESKYSVGIYAIFWIRCAALLAGPYSLLEEDSIDDFIEIFLVLISFD